VTKFYGCKSTINLAGLCRVLTYVILAATSTIAVAQAGHLDPTFGQNGIFTDSFSGGTNAATVVALQSDGKILVGGEIGNLGGVIRLNTNGTVDTSFGSAGIVTIRFRDVQNIATGIAVQTDGKILVGGTGLPGGGQLVRLNTNGSLDTTFNSGGSVFIFPGNPGPIIVQPDGRIVLSEAAFEVAQLQRFDSNGQLDTSFGSSGTAPLISAGAIALQSDGKFVISSQQVARYNSNGSLDTTFGILGQAPALPNAVFGTAVQTNEQIVTAGNVTSSISLGGNSSGFGLMRFSSNGLPDIFFGSHGGVITSFPASPQAGANALAIQSNGALVAAGSAGTTNASSFALARYLSQGQLDTTFGTGGRVTTNFGSGTVASISAIALQVDGKIVAVGSVNNSNFTVARYLVQ
jgi:uncharacterized delta-60 repeat protein